MLLVVPTGHPLGAKAGDVDLVDAADQRWIAGCPRCRTHLVTAAANQGFRPDIRHSTDDYVVTQTLVVAGLGVALLPALALEAAQDSQVRSIRLARHAPRRISLTGRADLPAGPATTAVREALIELTAARRGANP